MPGANSAFNSVMSPQPPPTAPRPGATRVTVQTWQSAPREVPAADQLNYINHVRCSSLDSVDSNVSTGSSSGSGASHTRQILVDGEFIPTRTVTKNPSIPSHNPMQFVKVQSPLYRKAEQQIKLVKEVKISKDTLKETEEEWQSNLDNWKSRRRKVSEKVIKRAEEMKQIEEAELLRQHKDQQRKIKTFSEIIEKRSSQRSYRLDLYVGGDDSGVGVTPEPDEQEGSLSILQSNTRSDTSEGMTSETDSLDSDAHNSEKISREPPKVPKKPHSWLTRQLSAENGTTGASFMKNHFGTNRSILTENVSSAEPSDIEALTAEDDVGFSCSVLNVDSGLESLGSHHRLNDTTDSSSDLSQDSCSGMDQHCHDTNDGTNCDSIDDSQDQRSRMKSETSESGEQLWIRVTAVQTGGSKEFGFSLSNKKNNAFVENIIPDSPADLAGLRIGDNILSLNNESTAGRSNSSLAFLMKQAALSDYVELCVQRLATKDPEENKPRITKRGISFTQKLALFGGKTSPTNDISQKPKISAEEELQRESLVLKRRSTFEKNSVETEKVKNRRSSCVSSYSVNGCKNSNNERRLSLDCTKSADVIIEATKKKPPPPVPAKPTKSKFHKQETIQCVESKDDVFYATDNVNHVSDSYMADESFQIKQQPHKVTHDFKKQSSLSVDNFDEPISYTTENVNPVPDAYIAVESFQIKRQPHEVTRNFKKQSSLSVDTFDEPISYTTENVNPVSDAYRADESFEIKQQPHKVTRNFKKQSSLPVNDFDEPISCTAENVNPVSDSYLADELFEIKSQPHKVTHNFKKQSSLSVDNFDEPISYTTENFSPVLDAYRADESFEIKQQPHKVTRNFKKQSSLPVNDFDEPISCTAENVNPVSDSYLADESFEIKSQPHKVTHDFKKQSSLSVDNFNEPIPYATENFNPDPDVYRADESFEIKQQPRKVKRNFKKQSLFVETFDESISFDETNSSYLPSDEQENQAQLTAFEQISIEDTYCSDINKTEVPCRNSPLVDSVQSVHNEKQMWDFHTTIDESVSPVNERDVNSINSEFLVQNLLDSVNNDNGRVRNENPEQFACESSIVNIEPQTTDSQNAEINYKSVIHIKNATSDNISAVNGNCTDTLSPKHEGMYISETFCPDALNEFPCPPKHDIINSDIIEATNKLEAMELIDDNATQDTEVEQIDSDNTNLNKIEDDEASASTNSSSDSPDTETVIDNLPTNLSPLPNDDAAEMVSLNCVIQNNVYADFNSSCITQMPENLEVISEENSFEVQESALEDQLIDYTKSTLEEQLIDCNQSAMEDQLIDYAKSTLEEQLIDCNQSAMEDQQIHYTESTLEEQLIDCNQSAAEDQQIHYTKSTLEEQLIDCNQSAVEDQLIGYTKSTLEEQLLDCNQSAMEDQLIDGNQSTMEDQLIEYNQSTVDEQVLDSTPVLNAYLRHADVENEEFCENELEESVDTLSPLDVIDQIEMKLMQQLEQQALDDFSEIGNGQLEEEVNRQLLYLSDDTVLLEDLDTPRNMVPPSEPPPPPPSEPEKNSFQRINSTKRIKKEIWRRRSDFLGLGSEEEISVDDLPPPPTPLEELLKSEMEMQREQRLFLEKQLPVVISDCTSLTDPPMPFVEISYLSNMDSNAEYMLEVLDAEVFDAVIPAQQNEDWEINKDCEILSSEIQEYDNVPVDEKADVGKLTESPQHKAKSHIQTLGAAPRAKIVDSNKWITQTEHVPALKQRSVDPIFQHESYNQNFWLAQEADQKTMTSGVHTPLDRRYSMPPVYGTKHPDVTVRTWSDREVETQLQPRPRSMVWQSHSSPVAQPQSYVPADYFNNPNASWTGNSNEEHEEDKTALSVNHLCSCCNRTLSEGSAMGIDTLQLYFHLECFKCCICQLQLGNGSCGTDVQVKNSQLYCPKCFFIE